MAEPPSISGPDSANAEGPTTNSTSSHPPSALSQFPSLVPALTFNFKIGPPQLVGGLSRGLPLTVVPIVSGSVLSEEGFGLPIDATVKGQGVDYVRNDPDGKRMRLDCGVVVEDLDGNLIHIHYTGVVDITPALSAILGGSPGSKTTEYGNSFIHVTFESGCERYRCLESGIFVGAGRFVVDERGLNVEYKISQVAKAGGNSVAPSSTAATTGSS